MNLRAVSLQSLVPAEVSFDENQLSVKARLSFSVLYLIMRREKITSEVFQRNFLSLLRELNRKYGKTIIVFDEAQVLPFVKGVNYRGILQFIHNNYSNVSVVLTGSMPGLLERIVSPVEAEEPGFARYVEGIRIPRWGRDEAVDFLAEGLRESSVSYEYEELREVYEELSGVPGFISYYGLLRLSKLTHCEVLSKTVEYAVTEWERDLRSFINVYNSPLYVHVLATLAEFLSGLSWGELQRELGKRLGKSVGESTLHRILSNLLKAGMIEKLGEKYSITDRSLRKASTHVSKRLQASGTGV